MKAFLLLALILTTLNLKSQPIEIASMKLPFPPSIIKTDPISTRTIPLEAFVQPQEKNFVEQNLYYSVLILTYEELEKFLLEHYLYVPAFYGAEKEQIQDLFKFCVMTYYENNESIVSFISLISSVVTDKDVVELSSLREEDSFTSFENLVQNTISGFPEEVPYNSLVGISLAGFFNPDLGEDSLTAIRELLKRVQRESEKEFLKKLLENALYFLNLKEKHPNLLDYPIRPKP